MYLNLATFQGRNFDDVVVEIYDGEVLKFRYTFTNVVFTKYAQDMSDGAERIDETVEFVFEGVSALYIETGDDQNSGDEHEITYDIAAGV